MKNTFFCCLALAYSLGCNSASSENPQEQKVIPSKALDEAPSSIKRIVAIGDLHADVDRAKQVFRLAKLIDENDKWIAKDTMVVQTGDLTDRGADGKETLVFIREMEKQASGNFITLIGNHEAMNVMGDLRYVNPADTKGFGGAAKRKQAFSPGGEWYEWILSHDVIVNVDGNLFAHGGLSATYQSVPPKELSERVRQGIKSGQRAPELGTEGPMWYRGHLRAPESAACAEIDKVLAAQNAKRIVVGHTTQRSGKIASRCGGKIIGIDIGLSDHYGANIGYLEITNDDARAVYPTESVDIPDPQ